LIIANPGTGMDAPIAVSLGDPAGIGPEITAKAWVARDIQRLSPFFAVGDARAIEAVWRGPVSRIPDPSHAAHVFPNALPVLQIEDAGAIVPGEPNAEGARCALAALEVAVGMVRGGAATAVVTGPVSKAKLHGIGFTYPGQTEFVAERCGVAHANTIMMLAAPGLRVVPVTTHVPLAEVAGMLSVDLLVCKGRATAKGLIRNFGVANPRLAFAGFNPHAGESGLLGKEDEEIIAPAVEQLRSEGIDAVGPLAADTMFHARARAKYDVAICCYHDQALIPLKTLYFDEGVNITLGLPVVRTSPDHGTAFDIAGNGKAEPGAMIAAIRMAAEAAHWRSQAA
jgi:4-hydroxythreonine-4-phosphate dehydrogenase